MSKIINQGVYAFTAKVDTNIADVFNDVNTGIVFEANEVYKSYIPGRSINAITTLEKGVGYIIYIKVDNFDIGDVAVTVEDIGSPANYNGLLRKNDVSMEAFLAIEGRVLEPASNYSGYNYKGTYEDGNVSGGMVCPVGKATYLEGVDIDFYTDAEIGMMDIQLRVNISRGGLIAAMPSIECHQRIFSKQSRTVRLNTFINENHNVDCYIFAHRDTVDEETEVSLEDETKRIYLNICPVGVRVVTNDFNLKAAYTMFVFGTSISDGSVGCLNSSEIYTFKMRDYYKSKGYDIRLNSSGAWKGAYAKDLVAMYNRSVFNCVTTPDVIVCEVGTNEGLNVFGSTEQGEFQTAVNQLIAIKQLNYPNAQMLFLGAFPNIDTTVEARLVTTRNIVSARVTAANDPSIKYLNLGTAFTPTVSSNYADGTHPNAQGNLAAFNTLIKPFLDLYMPVI